MPTEKNPTSSLVTVAWSVLLACVLLWLAVWLIEQIWGWLLLIASIAIITWIALWVVRWRRNRW